MAEAEAVLRGVPVEVPLTEPLKAPVGLRLGVAAAEAVLVGEAVVVRLDKAEPEELCELTGVKVSVKLPVLLGLGPTEGVVPAVAVAVAEEVDETEAVGEGVEEGVPSALVVSVEEAAALALAAAEAVLAAVPEGSPVMVQQLVDVGEAVLDTVPEGDMVGELEPTTERVVLKDCVTQGDALVESEKDADTAPVTVGALLTVMVSVDKGVPELEGLGVNVALPSVEGEYVMVGTALVAEPAADPVGEPVPVAGAEVEPVADTVPVTEGVADPEKLDETEGVTEVEGGREGVPVTADVGLASSLPVTTTEGVLDARTVSESWGEELTLMLGVTDTVAVEVALTVFVTVADPEAVTVPVMDTVAYCDVVIVTDTMGEAEPVLEGESEVLKVPVTVGLLLALVVGVVVEEEEALAVKQAEVVMVAETVAVPGAALPVAATAVPVGVTLPTADTAGVIDSDTVPVGDAVEEALEVPEGEIVMLLPPLPLGSLFVSLADTVPEEAPLMEGVVEGVAEEDVLALKVLQAVALSVALTAPVGESPNVPVAQAVGVAAVVPELVGVAEADRHSVTVPVPPPPPLLGDWEPLLHEDTVPVAPMLPDRVVLAVKETLMVGVALTDLLCVDVGEFPTVGDREAQGEGEMVAGMLPLPVDEEEGELLWEAVKPPVGVVVGQLVAEPE